MVSATPAVATVTEYTPNWSGFRIEKETGSLGAAEGAWQESLIPHITSGCFAPNGYDYFWVGQGGIGTYGEPFTQAGWALQQNGSIWAWWVRFDSTGHYDGLNIIPSANMSASEGDTVTMRVVWNAAHTDEWFSWKNLTTGQYWSVEKANSGSYFDSEDGSEFIFEEPTSGAQPLVQVNQLITYAALSEQIVPGWSADSRGVPINNGGTNSVDNAQHKIIMQDSVGGTRVDVNRPNDANYPNKWTATPQEC